jgi:hypothetical protein
MVTGSNSSGPQPPHVTLVPTSVDEQPPEAPEDLEIVLPSPQTFFLGGLFALSLFVVLYLASSIFLPIVLAFVLKRCCNRLCVSLNACTFRGRLLRLSRSCW